jgi:Flp pilus assembly protein TadD
LSAPGAAKAFRVDGTGRLRDGAWLALLAVLALAVFWPVTGFPFVEFDDDVFVAANRWVRSGAIGPRDVLEAFSTFTVGNWYPIPMLSHRLDVALFGLSPGRFHAVNLALHLASTLLLFRAFRRMTGRAAESATVAALFAIHPLHVETVAWIAERRDLLCGLFSILTIDAWGRYAESPSRRRYLATALWMALAMLSKPMAVTLPFVLLLLDGWPLGRLAEIAGSPAGARAVGLKRAIFEKWPLLAMAAADLAVTIVAQLGGGAVSGLEAVPLGIRVANALLSYVRYLGMTLWPSGLSVFYPFPSAAPPLWQPAGAAIALACLSALAIREARRRPYLLFGWLWYLGTLVPVIGLMQAGAQAIADRYTYLPLTGIFVIAAWGTTDALAAAGAGRRAAAAAWLLALASAGTLAHRQVGVWRDTEALFGHAVRVTEGNWLAHNNLGRHLWEKGRPAEAESHLREALRIRPGYAEAQHNLGMVLAARGAVEEATARFREAVRLAPADADSRLSLGVALARAGDTGEAVGQLREAVRLRPDHAEGRLDLGRALLEGGRPGEASAQFLEAIRLRPAWPDAHNMLGVALAEGGDPAEAARRFREALALRPGDEGIRRNLERVLPQAPASRKGAPGALK